MNASFIRYLHGFLCSNFVNHKNLQSTSIMITSEDFQVFPNVLSSSSLPIQYVNIWCVTHAILMHADPLLVSFSFRGAKNRCNSCCNPSQLGTGCQLDSSTVSTANGQRHARSRWICWWFPLLASNNRYFLSSLQKSQCRSYGTRLPSRCMFPCLEDFLSHWRKNQLTKWSICI